MPPYTVTWLPSAEDQQSVANAADRIDRLLGSLGASIGPGQGPRWLAIWPLEVVFRTSPDDCLVEVLQVTYAP